MRAFLGDDSLRALLALALIACAEPPGPGVNPPTQLLQVSGDAQRGEVDAALTSALTVRVADKQGAAVPSVGVTFEIAEGGGALEQGATVTDAAGIASTRWTLGPTAGSAHRVTARGTSVSIGTASFRATGIAAKPDTLLMVSGSNQSAPPGQQVSAPLVVRLRDRFGNPTPNQVVRFRVTTGGGLLTPEVATTDSLGEARSTWTLGLAVGGQVASARADSLEASPVAFAATATGVCAEAGLALRTSFAGLNDGTPSPDLTIAAGPGSIVIARNSGLVIRHKTGAPVEQKTMAQFFGGVRPAGGNALTDPYVIYDPSSKRFFIANADGSVGCPAGICTGTILLAVSKSEDPVSLSATDWYFYAFNRNRNLTATGAPTTTNQWGDFDHLGVTKDLLVLGMNMVSYDNGPPVGSGKIRVFDKARLIRGDPVDTWTDFADLPERPIPALGTVSDRLLLYFRSVCEAGEHLLIGAVEGTPSAPTLTLKTVPTPDTCFGSSPLEAAQQGGPALDINHLNVAPAVSGDHLWVARIEAANWNGGVITGVRWSEVNVSAWPSVSTTQQATLVGDHWRYAPAIAVDPMNNLAMIYARSSDTTFAGAYYSARLNADPANTLRSERSLRTGTAAYQQINAGRNRYTDYFSAAVDPADGSIWIFGMYATSLGSGTWVGNLVACP